ncbi:ComF family protein [Candidatus Orientia mediorientalis]|uniref:ComF family protein n=1 Tax=Candidatus Orientia mediorientalis TaxID=911112 RepID=UPI001E3AE92F|nr:ComF family protein [Candidatus Orientia mediorientalis]
MLIILLDYFFPKKCLTCLHLIQSSLPAGLCSTCWNKINFVTLPFCQKCGKTLPYDYGGSIICLKCYYIEPNYKLARALLIFDKNSKFFIHAFKYYNKPLIAMMIAQLLYIRYQSDILTADYIIPVPIHRFKLLLRGYNQAQVLGKYLSNVANLPMKSNVLIKYKWTKSQTKLAKKDRIKNINGSFKINNPEIIKNKKIILLDDVVTTGTTVNLCSKILKSAGARSIFVLCIAYT